MKRIRKIETVFSSEMVEQLKGSVGEYKVYGLKYHPFAERFEGEHPKLQTKRVLDYYQRASWEVGEDITCVRLEKRVFEVFVGLDSEYVECEKRADPKGDDLALGMLSKRHVRGSDIFYELPRKEQKQAEKINRLIGKGFENIPVSYQLSIFSPQLDLLENHIVLTDLEKVDFHEVMNVVSRACKKGVSGQENVVLRVFVVCHFSIAELQSFKDFNLLKRSFDSVRGCFITMGSPYELSVSEDEGSTWSDMEIYLCDTTLLASAGFKSLASLGRVIGLEKGDVSEHYKARMDLFLKEHRGDYLKYAMTDSIIALAYWVNLHVMTQRWIGSKLFQTVGSIAISYFNKYLKDRKVSVKGFHGKTHSNFDRYKYFGESCFYGGRNESITIGRIKEELYDVDLSGAYSIGMAHIPQLDHSKSFTSTKVKDFLDVNVAGFAEVEFSFPSGTKLPCLPVPTPTGLVYPLRGRTNCTAYELGLASRMGAKLSIIGGLIVPAVEGSKEDSVLCNFVRDQRIERKKHKKGTAENNFFKLILNSLYGRFGLGVHSKKYFDSRTGLHREGSADSSTNPYLASLITGYIRSVVSELALEIVCRGYLIVSMTTDGLLTTCSHETAIREIKSPLVTSFRKAVVSVKAAEESYLELKGSTQEVFSWKTRGQFALDHGEISALAGLQAPGSGVFKVVKEWLEREVCVEGSVTQNMQCRLSSLIEVWGGSPFRRLEYFKFISTQYDFKRDLVFSDRDGDFVESEPWLDLKAKDKFLKTYVKGYPYKVSNAGLLRKFKVHQSEVDAQKKAERSRKKRIDLSLRKANSFPEMLKQCTRCALQGKLGFSREYTALEIIRHLRLHNIKEYKVGARFCKIDSNFCKNQKRLPIVLNKIGLTSDVLQVIGIFQRLDSKFNPLELLYNESTFKSMRPCQTVQLERVLPASSRNHAWCKAYIDALEEVCQMNSSTAA